MNFTVKDALVRINAVEVMRDGPTDRVSSNGSNN